MTDDRSERLRKRRKLSAKKGSESTSESDSTNSDESSRSGNQSRDGNTENNDSDQEKPSQDKNTNSVKQNQTGTYMYLPNSQVKDLSRVYNVLKAQYEYEYDDTFEKNRHFYPLVIRHGLDSLDELDPSEVRDRLDELP